MSIFKNENEVNFVGGKKHWLDVIKNTGDGELLIWKQPEEDFNTGSKLIVAVGEEAIFVKGGKVEGVFEAGTYSLKTKNYPFLSRIVNAFTGGVSRYNCFVYFVRKADSKEILWGTQTPVQVRDKKYGIRTDVKARGAYVVRIENAPKFLEKMIGANVNFETQDGLYDYFAEELQSIVKATVAKTLNEYPDELIGIDAFLQDLSKTIKEHLSPLFGEYGLQCVRFSLSGLDVDTTKYDEIDVAQVEALSTVKKAQGDKGAMDVLGENWEKQKSVEILKDVANNPSGGLGSSAAGLGLGVASMGVFSTMAGQAIGQTTGQPPQKANPLETLETLKKMLDGGLIEQSEYDAKKAEILKNL